MKKIKLIIVENDKDEQEFMEEGFRASGLFQLVALLRNGDELFDFLESYTEQLPDVVLSDLNMPGKNGYDVLAGMKENTAFEHIPVVITSTSNAREFINKSMSLGAAFFLVKPDTFNEYREFAQKLYQKLSDTALIKN